MESVVRMLEEREIERLLVFTDRKTGLRAFLVIDDLRLGPAAGGTRTARYPDARSAIADAASLARAMTLKCALAGLDAGGAKLVVMDHGHLDREAAFRILGSRVEELGGLFTTAGDMGTTAADLEAMASRTSWVRTDERGIAEAVAHGLYLCTEACVAAAGRPGLAGLRIAVQGCGTIGSAVARELSEAGAELVVADLDPAASGRVAAETGASILPPDELLGADVDVLAPCAAGGVITRHVVPHIRAWAICGAANNLLAGDEVANLLSERNVLLVPDMIASAGGVIHGVCEMRNRTDAMALIGRLAQTTRTVLETARHERISTAQVARRIAREHLAGACT